MRTKLILLPVLLLLLLSPFALAADDNCAGVLGTIKCFFFGDPDERAVAGSAWWDRGENVVGKSAATPDPTVASSYSYEVLEAGNSQNLPPGTIQTYQNNNPYWSYRPINEPSIWSGGTVGNEYQVQIYQAYDSDGNPSEGEYYIPNSRGEFVRVNRGDSNFYATDERSQLIGESLEIVLNIDSEVNVDGVVVYTVINPEDASAPGSEPEVEPAEVEAAAAPSAEPELTEAEAYAVAAAAKEQRIRQAVNDCLNRGDSRNDCYGTNSEALESYATTQLDNLQTQNHNLPPREGQSNSAYIDSIRTYLDGCTVTPPPSGCPGTEELTTLRSQLDALEEVQDSSQELFYKTAWLEEGELEIPYVSQGFGYLSQLAGTLSSYRPLSNLLLPDLTREMSSWTDSTFFNTWSDLNNVAPDAIFNLCDYDDKRNANEPGESSSFVQTTAGTYQFVGSIQFERSDAPAPILCEYDPNQEEFYCPLDLICKEDSFCYETEDSETPKMGYFHKITWGVSAPQDEKSTPYIDENGKAVAFNIYIDGFAIYQVPGLPVDNKVLTLNNGDSDSGLIVRYLPEKYTAACIKFGLKVKDTLGNEVDQICATAIISEAGRIEYADSDRSSSSSTESRTSTSGEVGLRI